MSRIRKCLFILFIFIFCFFVSGCDKGYQKAEPELTPFKEVVKYVKDGLSPKIESDKKIYSKDVLGITYQVVEFTDGDVYLYVIGIVDNYSLSVKMEETDSLVLFSSTSKVTYDYATGEFKKNAYYSNSPVEFKLVKLDSNVNNTTDYVNSFEYYTSQKLHYLFDKFEIFLNNLSLSLADLGFINYKNITPIYATNVITKVFDPEYVVGSNIKMSELFLIYPYGSSNEMYTISGLQYDISTKSVNANTAGNYLIKVRAGDVTKTVRLIIGNKFENIFNYYAEYAKRGTHSVSDKWYYREFGENYLFYDYEYNNIAFYKSIDNNVSCELYFFKGHPNYAEFVFTYHNIVFYYKLNSNYKPGNYLTFVEYESKDGSIPTIELQNLANNMAKTYTHSFITDIQYDLVLNDKYKISDFGLKNIE